MACPQPTTSRGGPPARSCEMPVMESLESRLALSVAAAAAVVPVPQDRRDLVTTGRNRFFILEPGYVTVFAGNEDGKHKRLTITVTDRTAVVDGITTRVVIERLTSNGHVEEVAKNFFAFDRRTHNVFYFGEDVNIYKHGVVVSHESQWRSGVNGAKFGLIMPGDAALGTVFQQERAPGVALDMAEIIETGRRAHVPAGTFKGSIETRETTPLEPGAVEFKLYAPGVGLVQDDTLALVSRSFSGTGD